MSIDTEKGHLNEEYKMEPNQNPSQFYQSKSAYDSAIATNNMYTKNKKS
jgi:hypothetical protein